MIAIDRDGQRHEGHIRRFLTGWNLHSFTLDPEDVRWLCLQNDHQLIACVRQLDARTHRVQDLVRNDGSPVMDTKGQVRVIEKPKCPTCGGDCGQC